jgi:hypothetical protein
MNRTISLLIALMAALLAESHAQAPKQAPDGGFAVASRVDEFLTEPLFVPMQQLWEKRGGWGGILTAKDGTVVAFQSPGGGSCRRSRDGGITWDPEIPIASEARNGCGLVDETTGDVLYVNPSAYSTLAVGRSGTPSQGKIYLLFEGGPRSWDEAVQVAVFNLSWLLDGRDITSLLGKIR